MRKHSLDGEVEAGTNRPLRGATGPRSGLHALSLAVLHLVFTTPPAMAQAPSGTFILECGEENVLMGIHGRVGLWIDQLEGWCIQIDGAGRWLGTPFTTMRAGGAGGIGPYDLRCPSGEALYKLEGTSGRYVNSIKLFCIKLASDGHVTGGAIERGAVRGGMAALDRWTQTCSGDQPAMAVSGFDGDYVDAFFTTVCAYPVILKRLWISQTQVSGNATLAGEVHLSRNVDENFTVNLKSTSTAVSVPSTVTIASGRDRATFTIRIQAVSMRGQMVTLTAWKGNLKATALLTLLAR